MAWIRSRLLASAVLILCSASPGQSGFVSGMDLLSFCAPSRADPVYRLKVAECRGYVIGVADTFDCKTQLLGFTWQSRNEASQRELVDLVVAFLRQHPQHLRYEADGLIAAALSEKFPCP